MSDSFVGQRKKLMDKMFFLGSGEAVQCSEGKRNWCLGSANQKPLFLSLPKCIEFFYVSECTALCTNSHLPLQKKEKNLLQMS